LRLRIVWRRGETLEVQEHLLGEETTVPRHTEIDNDLAKDICKQLGIEKIRQEKPPISLWLLHEHEKGAPQR